MLQSIAKNSQEAEKTYEINIGPKAKVEMDKKSRTRMTHFPFELPDGENAILIICRLKDEEWVPAGDIKSIKITFK